MPKEPLQDLIDLRKARGLSQQFVAERIDVSRSTYSGYENGYYEIPFKKVIILKKLLKTKDDNIFLQINDRK